MPVASFKRKSKVATIVPLAIVSGVWSVSLVGYNAAQANNAHDHGLPDGTNVPSSAIQAPANLPQNGTAAPAVPQGKADQVVSGASTSGIPATALSAYQNAARIIDSAKKSCNLPWELVAAIGRVESDHGRFGGNHLNTKGFAVPGIYGPVLNGKDGTQLIADTDNGTVDGNKSYDRAVGPMQFIPSTWQVVKVDADNDGLRDPQNINDASLATSVYLCSGDENLSRRAGQEAAVYRYNHSHSYVNLVLRIMEAYQTGDYTSVPSNSLGGTLLAPDYANAVDKHRHHANATQDPDDPTYDDSGFAGTNDGDHGTSAPNNTGNSGSTGSTGKTGSTGNTGGNGGSGENGTDPVSTLTNGIKGAISAAPSVLADPVKVLDSVAALALCKAKLPVVAQAFASMCAKQATGKSEDQLGGIVRDLLKTLGL